MIYLDYHATTPCDPKVLEAMLPYFGVHFANPSSTVHQPGRDAARAVEAARQIVASLIGASSNEIIFTAGATESNNIALQGLVNSGVTRKRLVTTSIEHKSILEQFKEFKQRGFDAVILPVDQFGLVDLEAAKDAINEETLFVSIQAASNEIGTIQPLKEISTLAHHYGALVHSDAAQAVGKISLDVDDWGIDLLSISSHKLYGPKGVGALYVRGGMYALPLKPLIYGGGQENNLRSGTLNVPGIVGMAEACKLCQEYMPEEAERIKKLRDYLEEILLGQIKDLKRNGAIHHRLPNNSNLTFSGIDAEALIVNTPKLAISTGSACTSGAPEPSHVLQAIGLSRRGAYSTIRIGLGRFTTQDEVERAANSILEAVNRLESI